MTDTYIKMTEEKHQFLDSFILLYLKTIHVRADKLREGFTPTETERVLVRKLGFLTFTLIRIGNSLKDFLVNVIDENTLKHHARCRWDDFLSALDEAWGK